MIAVVHLFGGVEAGIRFNLARSQGLLKPLARNDYLKAQIFYGFMHFFGLGLLESFAIQSRYLIHLCCYRWKKLVQMILGYWHYLGLGILQSWENALDYYGRAASSVERTFASPSGFPYSGQPALKRLSNEYENSSRSSTHQLGNNLIQYYKFLADKGDVHAQVGLDHWHCQRGQGVE